MQIVLNGEKHETEAVTVAALLSELGLEGQPAAVERNAEVVKRKEHEATRLTDGDQIEVVTLVGGG
ncbi:MAG: sulfur carrier protein ThiS [Phycisphaeraceae bacterium]